MTNAQPPISTPRSLQIRAVIFDMGGVLVRADDQTPRRRWEMRLGLPEGKLAQLAFGSEVGQRSLLGETTEEQIWNYVARELNLTDQVMRDLIVDFWSCEQVDAELVQFARSLRPRYKAAILSNASLGARQAMTRKFQLDNVFDPTIISAEEGFKKPDTRIFHLAAERIGIAPGEAIFIDDVLENVKAARAIGMYAVQFQNTAQAITEVRQYLGEPSRDK